MASTHQKATFLQNDAGKLVLKTKLVSSGLTRKEDNNERKTLQTLQYSSLGDKNNTQNSKTKEKKKQIKPLGSGKQQVTIFEDPELPSPILKTFDDKAIQTEEKSKQRRNSCEDEDIDQEAYDLMVNEEIPESYWKHLAEERRLALNDSLHENETLHKEIPESYWKHLAEERRLALNDSLHENETLHKEMDELREENAKLSQLASQTEYFATVIKDLLGDEKDENSEENAPDSCDHSESTECKSETFEDVDDSDSNKDIVKVNFEESELDKGDNSNTTCNEIEHVDKTELSVEKTSEDINKDGNVPQD